jgi:hypothetical protein
MLATRIDDVLRVVVHGGTERLESGAADIGRSGDGSIDALAAHGSVPVGE